MTSLNNTIKAGPAVRFRWSYFLLPTMIFLVSLVLTAAFYARLPATLAYHYNGAGVPDRWLGRNQIVFVTLLPQFFLTLLSVITTWGVARLSSQFQQIQISVKPERIISLMGNIVALPEMILAFFMLDVYLYNTAKIHIMPVWAFGTIVMVAGAVFLAAFFFQSLRGARRTTK